MTNRPIHPVSAAVPIALAVIVCIGAMGDGSAGSVWIVSPRAKQAGSGSPQDSVAGWLTGLGKVVCQIRVQALIWVVIEATPFGNSLIVQQRVLCGTDSCPIDLQQLPQLTDLPPPSA